MNASSSDERNNDKDVPQTPYYDAYYCNEGNNDDVAPDQATYDKNINSNYDERKMIMGLPLIHLQMVEMMKQLTMVKKKRRN